MVYWGNDDQDGSLRAEIGELIGETLLADQILGDLEGQVPVATALVPESVDQLSTLWIYATSTEFTSSLAQAGWKSKGGYSIGEGRIDLYEKDGLTLASSRLGEWTAVSSRSRTIEQALRSANGTLPYMKITNEPGFHVNAGEFGRLVAPLATPAHRADLAKSFQGLGVVHIRPSGNPTNPEWTIQVPLTGNASRLVHYLMSGSTRESASFGVPPGMTMSMVWNDPHGSRRYDSLRSTGQSAETLRLATDALAAQLSPEVAMYVSEAPSVGVAYVRKANMSAIGGIFAELYQRGVLDGDREVFVGRDPALARAICSGLCDLSRYAIGLRDDGVVISSSETLVRRLMVSDSAGSSLDSRVPAAGDGSNGEAGSYGWVDVSSVISAARAIGWMPSDRPVPGILRRFATIAYSVQTRSNTMAINIKLSTGANAPTRTDLVLAWQYPLRGDVLVSEPVLAVLNGNPTILATTSTGRVLAIGSDGTLQFEVTTGTQVPVGGVEIYDWYANRSPVVVQAAGSAIYAWSPSGSLLPGFPFVLDSPISAPILITDVDGNAEPEILAATDDERLHLINRDGRGVAGWPVYTDGMVVERPVALLENGSWSVQVTTIHATEVFDRLAQRKTSRPHLDDYVEIPDSLKTSSIPSPFSESTPALYGQFPLVVDIDGDGRSELIVVLDGQLRCYRLPTARTD